MSIELTPSSRLNESKIDNGDDTTDIADWGLCQFDQSGDALGGVAESLQSECCLTRLHYTQYGLQGTRTAYCRKLVGIR